MAKTFYTERDIVDLMRQGVRSLIVDDDVVLTDSAYEMARKLGLELLRTNDQPPGSPVRPYIAKLPSPSAAATREPSPQLAPTPPSPTTAPATASTDPLYQRIYAASVAKLGDSVDPKLLESIIQRVLKSITPK
jgi:hypothetical protein